MTVTLNADNYQSLYEQVNHAHQPSDLPFITVNLHRPMVTFNFLLLLIIFCFMIFVLGVSLIDFFHRPVFDQFPEALFILIFFSLITLFGITEYRTQQIKFFSPTVIDRYYCQFTPSHFEWVFNDKHKQLDWRQIFIIEKFMTQRMSQAHIFLGIKNAEPLVIYSNHLPLSYRKVWQLLYDYQIKAVGKKIIKIQ